MTRLTVMMSTSVRVDSVEGVVGLSILRHCRLKAVMTSTRLKGSLLSEAVVDVVVVGGRRRLSVVGHTRIII